MSVAGILGRLACAVLQRQNAVINILPVCTVKAKYLSNKPPEPIILEGVPASAVTRTKSKRPIVPRITLISGNDDIMVTTLDDAQKLALRRNLKLVKIMDLDTKTQRPIYKLMTAADYVAEDRKQKKEKTSASPYKGEKVLMLTSVITDHDLQTQLRKIEKWISKDYEVRVAISSASGTSDIREEIYRKIEQHFKDNARLLQKRTKGQDIRFQIVPPKKDKNKEASGGNNNNL